MTTILYFGRLADSLGAREENRALPDHVRDTNALRAWLDAAHGAGGVLLAPSVRIALDAKIVCEPAPIGAAQVIAFMPPVGGG